jgi:sialate O-acetylesterase
MRTAAVFSDNMVLQRCKDVRIFGTCTQREKAITVSVPELGVSTPAVIKNGRWEAVLPPMNACDSCTLTVTCGAVKIVYRNVAVGEVWLAGGQSNMEYELHNDKNGTAELKNCSGENVRFYYTPKCPMKDEVLAASEAESRWALPSEKSAEAWSAVGYYFAKELSRRLGVTIGVIGCNWGGTSASAWVEREYLSRDVRLHPYLDDYDNAVKGRSDEEMIAEYDEYTALQNAWGERVEKCTRENPGIKWDEVLRICGKNLYPGPMGIKNPMRPCGLAETMVKRVAPYTLAGFLWYQGESDDHRPVSYCALMTALADNWRTLWHDDSLPFLTVQLPMFRYADEPDTRSWAYIREAQMNFFRTVKNTGMAVALDCGELNNIHPLDKAPIGHRLYLQSLSEVYGLADRSLTTPPIYSGFTASGNTALLRFSNCRGFDLRGELSGFETAGSDNVFRPAKAEIRGTEILLTADRPVLSVRYKWVNYAGVELYGKNEIPVPPFRDTHDI